MVLLCEGTRFRGCSAFAFIIVVFRLVFVIPVDARFGSAPFPPKLVAVERTGDTAQAVHVADHSSPRVLREVLQDMVVKYLQKRDSKQVSSRNDRDSSPSGLAGLDRHLNVDAVLSAANDSDAKRIVLSLEGAATKTLQLLRDRNHSAPTTGREGRPGENRGRAAYLEAKRVLHILAAAHERDEKAAKAMFLGLQQCKSAHDTYRETDVFERQAQLHAKVEKSKQDVDRLTAELQQAEAALQQQQGQLQARRKRNHDQALRLHFLLQKRQDQERDHRTEVGSRWEEGGCAQQVEALQKRLGELRTSVHAKLQD